MAVPSHEELDDEDVVNEETQGDSQILRSSSVSSNDGGGSGAESAEPSNRSVSKPVTLVQKKKSLKTPPNTPATGIIDGQSDLVFKFFREKEDANDTLPTVHELPHIQVDTNGAKEEKVAPTEVNIQCSRHSRKESLTVGSPATQLAPNAIRGLRIGSPKPRRRESMDEP